MKSVKTARLSFKRLEFQVLLFVLAFFCFLHTAPLWAVAVKKKVRLAPVSGQDGRYQVLPAAKPQGRSPASLVPAALDAPSLAPTGLNEMSPDLDGGSEDSSSTTKNTSFDPRQLTVLRELPTPEMMESAYPIPVQSGQSLYLGLGGDFSVNLTERQVGALTIGYHKSFMDLFIRGKFGATRWGLMEARPGTEDGVETADEEGVTYPSFGEPDSEYNRVRTPEDAWTAIDVQLGVGYKANLLPVIFPHFSQGVYLTVGSGRYTDQVNRLEFTPFMIGFDAVMQYHLGEGKRWAIEGRVGYQYGYLNRLGATTVSSRHLPVRWLDSGLSLVLWF
jgi:hypothetical protein